MKVGIMEVELLIYESHSLKDKRQVVKSIKDKLSRTFNLAIAETDALDEWSRAILGITTVSNSAPHIESMMQSVFNFFDQRHDVEVIQVFKEIQHF